jgi:hypothetical protein
MSWHEFHIWHDILLFHYDKTLIVIVLDIKTQVSHVMWIFLTHNKLFLLLIWHILHPLKWRFFWGPSLWWVLACIITWISHMTWIFFPSLWQYLKYHSFSLCHYISLTCDKSLKLFINQYWSIFQFDEIKYFLINFWIKAKGSNICALFIKIKCKFEPIYPTHMY